jgi:hypothetical protein
MLRVLLVDEGQQPPVQHVHGVAHRPRVDPRTCHSRQGSFHFQGYAISGGLPLPRRRLTKRRSGSEIAYERQPFAIS